MKALEKWYLEDSVFRLTPGSRPVGGIGCGFMDKSEVVSDVIDETYDRLAMVYLLRGSGRYEDSFGLRHTLHAGDVFFRCPNRSHSTFIDPGSQWREVFVAVRQKWYALLSEMTLLDPSTVRVRIGSVPEIPAQIHALMERLRVARRREETARIELALVDVIMKVLEFAKEVERRDSPYAEVLECARKRIIENACERTSLEVILADLGLSYSRLRVLFREAYGCSPGEFRIRNRMDAACVLLKTSATGIAGIAAQLGYADPFVFSKQFKQYVGVAPSRFRAS